MIHGFRNFFQPLNQTMEVTIGYDPKNPKDEFLVELFSKQQ